MENEGLKWLIEAAEANDIDAQRKLGEIYFLGNNVERDFEKARYWFEKVSQTGDSEAFFAVGAILYHYENPHKDRKLAVKYLEKAANLGNADAQSYLVRHYMETDVNYERALYWAQKGAEQGDAESEYRLGYLYNKGLGVEKDIDKSISLLKSAAEKGHKDAQTSLKNAVSASSSGCLISVVSLTLVITLILSIVF